MMEKYIYLYRMSHDSGNAPCVYDLGIKMPRKPLLSLACCKGGGVRRDAEGRKRPVKSGLRRMIGNQHGIGEKDGPDEIWVCALYRGDLLYAAKISQILPMRDYFDKFRHRMDCIYAVAADVPEDADAGYLRRLHGVNPYFHPKEDETQRMRDEAGKYVLLSQKYFYFGGEHKTLTADFAEEVSKLPFPKNRGHRCITQPDDMANFETLIQKLEEKYPTGYTARRPSEPLEKSGQKGCYQR